MRRRLAQGLTMALLVGLGAAQGTTSSRSAIQNAATRLNAQRAYLAAAALPKSKPYQVGTASWYGEYFVGRRTASGEPYDMNELTAAHPTLPLGTLIKVTNLKNRRSVILRINDRGPMVPGRIIDLSYGAARVLKFQQQGLQQVRIDVVSARPPLVTMALLRSPVFGQ
jgi:rare lipoprotein A